MNYCKYCGKETKTRGYQCNSCVSRIRRHRTKQRAVEYLGGKCVRCGYDKHLAALEFHHTNPEEKDFNFGDAKNKKWDSIKKELDKCILLCSNCHRIEHSKYDNDDMVSKLMEGKWSAKPLEVSSILPLTS